MLPNMRRRLMIRKDGKWYDNITTHIQRRVAGREALFNSNTTLTPNASWYGAIPRGDRIRRSGIAINLVASHQCGLNCVPTEVAKTHPCEFARWNREWLTDWLTEGHLGELEDYIRHIPNRRDADARRRGFVTYLGLSPVETVLQLKLQSHSGETE